jgi:hypothetical protein
MARYASNERTSDQGAGEPARGVDLRVMARERAITRGKHVEEPPVLAPSVEMGQHIVQVCRGCHGPALSGGTRAGDPDVPVVANITPHETGLKSWSESDFIRALREGKRKDGTAISKRMPWQAYGQISDTELKAVWAHLQIVPRREKGNR